MKKTYAVKVMAVALVVVEDAESEEKAIEYAYDEIERGDFQICESIIEEEITSERDLEMYKSHADCIA